MRPFKRTSRAKTAPPKYSRHGGTEHCMHDLRHVPSQSEYNTDASRMRRWKSTTRARWRTGRLYSNPSASVPAECNIFFFPRTITLSALSNLVPARTATSNCALCYVTLFKASGTFYHDENTGKRNAVKCSSQPCPACHVICLCPVDSRG